MTVTVLSFMRWIVGALGAAFQSSREMIRIHGALDRGCCRTQPLPSMGLRNVKG